MRALWILFLGMMMAAPAFAEAPRFTGAQLEEMCRSESNLDYGYCAGYVTAVADELIAGSIGPYRACNHDAVKSQQYVDIFRNYVASFPESRAMSADEAAAAAFARAFPCQN